MEISGKTIWQQAAGVTRIASIQISVSSGTSFLMDQGTLGHRLSTRSPCGKKAAQCTNSDCLCKISGLS